jgi:hypothetical protein
MLSHMCADPRMIFPNADDAEGQELLGRASERLLLAVRLIATGNCFGGANLFPAGESGRLSAARYVIVGWRNAPEINQGLEQCIQCASRGPAQPLAGLFCERFFRRHDNKRRDRVAIRINPDLDQLQAGEYLATFFEVLRALQGSGH